MSMDSPGGESRPMLGVVGDNNPNNECGRVSRSLRDSTLSKRLKAVEALAHLARENPGKNHVRSMSLLSDFLRHAKLSQTDENETSEPEYPPDIMAAFRAVTERNKAQTEVEEAVPGFMIDLSGLHLAGMELADANLARTCLVDANMRHAKLKRTNLANADMKNANLANADMKANNLNRTDLTHAFMPGANLAYTVMSKANLTKTYLRDASLKGADLRGANLAEATLIDADLTEADLTGADLTNADLTGANLTGALIDGAPVKDRGTVR